MLHKIERTGWAREATWRPVYGGSPLHVQYVRQPGYHPAVRRGEGRWIPAVCGATVRPGRARSTAGRSSGWG